MKSSPPLVDKSNAEVVFVDTRGIKNIKYVIFPNNKWIQLWDLWMIFAIWYYAFATPFAIGISRGYITDNSKALWIFTLILNASFLVDTYLPFFRSYYDENGRLVFSLKRIRRKYIRSGLFFVNVLASLPITSISSFGAVSEGIGWTNDAFYDQKDHTLTYISILKLLRLFRIRKMMANSNTLNIFWERVDIETALSFQFLLMLTVVSHVIACMWGWIVFLEVKSFSSAAILSEDNPNWIQGWYSEAYVEGGLNPLGYHNALPRYFLSLFWAVQSMTSIGYGNIHPVTLVEYIIANALMLLCGIFWAYIIGKLAEAVASGGSLRQEFTTRMNEANTMIRDFTEKKLSESVIGSVHTDTSERIRRFITSQRNFNSAKSYDESNGCTLYDAYPTLRILSPELQRVTVLHLGHSLLETVPYLSSKYLSPAEQADVILQSVRLEFSSGERFVMHPNLGRGCLLFRRYSGCITASIEKTWHRGSVNIGDVLLDDNHFNEHRLAYHFVGFTKVLFVPRSVIMKVLQSNKRAWKECARWKYFMASFVLYSLRKRNEMNGTLA